MIETVQERQRGAYNFESHYENLCALQDSCPLPAVKAHLADGTLDINADRIRQQDWLPIFNSIKINKNIKFIGIRSYFHYNLNENTPDKKAKVLRSKIPVIRTKELMSNLVKSIRDCLGITECLEYLEFQGLPLKEAELNILAQGLMKNKTVRHLAFESCRIGDASLTALCSSLRLAGNVTTLNLTNCSLSPIGMTSLADLIKFQAMSRHNDAWRESLRYRWANFDSMRGIRRVTLNSNLALGDDGAQLLAEALKDDLWVKAIDMQECNLSGAAVRHFLHLLKYNTSLVVLDLRLNPRIDKHLLMSVTEQVLINGNGKETEYKWLRAEDIIRSRDENYERHPRTYYNGPTKPLESTKRPVFKPAGKSRSKSASSLDRRSQHHNCHPNSARSGLSEDDEDISPSNPLSRGHSIQRVSNSSKGQPWRTAARATRVKGYPPDHLPGRTSLEEHYETPGPVSGHAREDAPVHRVHSASDRLPLPQQHHQQRKARPDSNSVVSPLIELAQQQPPMPDSLKQLRMEIFQLRNQVEKCKKDKKKIEMKFIEIHNENQRLRNTIKLKDKTNAVIIERTRQSSLMNNQCIIDAIENSFRQFNAFLDMLRQAGLGKIVSAAGMDEFATTTSLMDQIYRGTNTGDDGSIHVNSNNEEFYPQDEDILEDDKDEEEDEQQQDNEDTIIEDESHEAIPLHHTNHLTAMTHNATDQSGDVHSNDLANRNGNQNVGHKEGLYMDAELNNDGKKLSDSNCAIYEDKILASAGWKSDISQQLNHQEELSNDSAASSIKYHNPASGDINNNSSTQLTNQRNDDLLFAGQPANQYKPSNHNTSASLNVPKNNQPISSKSNSISAASTSLSSNHIEHIELPGYRPETGSNQQQQPIQQQKSIASIDSCSGDNNYTNYKSSTSSLATSSHVLTKATTKHATDNGQRDGGEEGEGQVGVGTRQVSYNQQGSLDANLDVDLDQSFEDSDY